MKVSLPDLVERIKACHSGFFSVEFIKRTTGERRKMICRQDVKKHLKGGELKYDPEEKGLLTVYSMDAKGYRSIPLENLISATINGETYDVGE